MQNSINMFATLRKVSVLTIFAFVIHWSAFAQHSSLNLRDSLDNQLDLSDFVVNMHGFVPYPVIISEPALGNFGGALALVFISPKKNNKETDEFHFPDITAVAGMYTLNNSWATGAFRQGSFPSLGLRYQAALAYADVNLNFYRDFAQLGEKEFLFNLAPLFLMTDASKNIWKNKYFLGLKYQFARMKVNYDAPQLIDTIFEVSDFDKNLGSLGFYGEYDNRNTIFTPDKGIRFKATYNICRDFLGSDFNTNRLEMFTNVFFKPATRWVSGFKAEWIVVGESSPFYYYPFIIMRGIPVMRYQGKQTLLFETEQRYDLNLRWSLVGFLGTGKAFNDSGNIGDNIWHTAGGAGFRYLAARLFNLRMGVDVAAGPDQFAYYIVFGHYWNR